MLIPKYEEVVTGFLLTPYDIVSGKINSGDFNKVAGDFDDICSDLEDMKFNITNLLHYFIQIKQADVALQKKDIIR